MKRILAALCLALGVTTLVAPARADVTWLVNGLFSDGSTLSGSFSLNQYGFVSAIDLTTQDAGSLTGVHYILGASYPASNGDAYLESDPGPYTGALRLNFDGAIADVGNAPDTGTVSILSTSFECQDSQGCSSASGNTRYLVSGTATTGSVPEPATWGMMILGFGMVGAGLRVRRGRAVAA